MAKEILTRVKLQCPGGQATPAPPVGPALGQHGVNIGEFVRKFNDKTKNTPGLIIPVIITIFKDKTFDFIMKSPPASVLLKKAAGVAKGSAQPNKEKVGKVTKDQLREIALQKIKDLNTSQEKIIPCDGIFIYVGFIPDTVFVKDKLTLDEAGFIITGEDMSTSCDGIFACGDCRRKTLYQVITACGDGAVAADSAYRYLVSKK